MQISHNVYKISKGWQENFRTTSTNFNPTFQIRSVSKTKIKRKHVHYFNAHLQDTNKVS